MGQVEIRSKLRCKEQTEISQVKCMCVRSGMVDGVREAWHSRHREEHTERQRQRETETENMPEAQVSEIRLKWKQEPYHKGSFKLGFGLYLEGNKELVNFFNMKRLVQICVQEKVCSYNTVNKIEINLEVNKTSTVIQKWFIVVWTK